MGALVAVLVNEAEGLELVGSYDSGNAVELDALALPADLVIDFSAPAALPHVLAYVRRTGASLVSGTTGLSQDDHAALAQAASRAAIVWSPNFSLGVAVLRHLAAQAAAALEGFDVEIVETHHNRKADAPSGTAKALLAAVDPDGSCEVVYGREGMTGARPARQVGVHAVRGGTVAGTHEVHFFGMDEEVCLTHRATSRQVFASGAIAAAQRILGVDPGLYTFDQLMFGE